MHILIIDHDPFILETVSHILTEEGYTVSTAMSASDALHVLRRRRVNLVILERAMPGSGGLDLCRRIRQIKDVPIIILSEKKTARDVVIGLQAGADDYIAKPFHPQELTARVRAILRRVNTRSVYDLPSHVVVGDMKLNLVEHTVTIQGERTVALTPTEQRLLRCLMANAGRILSREALMAQALGHLPEGRGNYIDVCIGRLRQKLEANPRRPQRIITVWGKGYRLEPRPRLKEG